MFHKFVPGGDEDPIFNPRGPDERGPGTNLADIILEKIAEHEAKQTGGSESLAESDGPPEGAVQIPAKAIEVYEKWVVLFYIRIWTFTEVLTRTKKLGLA